MLHNLALHACSNAAFRPGLEAATRVGPSVHSMATKLPQSIELHLYTSAERFGSCEVFSIGTKHTYALRMHRGEA